MKKEPTIIRGMEVDVIMITILEGNGVDIAYREVRYIYRKNGEFIGKFDPIN